MNIPRKRQNITFIFSASLLLLVLFPAHVSADALTLAWDPNIEDDLAGYNIYYGTQSGDYDSVIDVGYVTYHTIRGLEPETRYYLALTAYDTSWNESDFSAEVSGISNPDGPEIYYLEMGCFIATAAYGSYLNPHVEVLREFRDESLRSNSLGRKIIDSYYRYGPMMANHIEKNGLLQLLTRQALLPLIGMSSLSLNTTASQKLLLLSLFLLLILTIALRSSLSQSR